MKADLRSPHHAAARGFTIVEVVAVVVVLAVIAAVVVGKYFAYQASAAKAAEDAAVGAVRTAIGQYQLNEAVSGVAVWPPALDTVPSGTAAGAGFPFFASVLNNAITDGWSKGSTANTYIGPAGNTYTYDPATGRFSQTATAVASGGGAGSAPQITLTNATTWSPSSVPLSAGVFVAAGYTLSGTELLLTDSSPAFTESARRVAITGQAIAAGNYTLTLDTMLSNYDNQLNYWQVYAVSSSAQLDLSGNTLNWGTAPAGTKLLAQDYAPPPKSDGSWYNYTNNFTISAADAQTYSTIVVAMAGSKFSSQQLGWRNVSLTLK